MLTTFKATAVKTAEGLQVNTDSRGFKLVLDEPTEMGDDNKLLFRRILGDFTTAFQFDLPDILGAPTPAPHPAAAPATTP